MLIIISENKVHFYPLYEHHPESDDPYLYKTDLMYLDVRKAYIKNTQNKNTHFCLIARAEFIHGQLHRFNT